jgi:hypothetical protein
MPEPNGHDRPDEEERWLIAETQADLRRMIAYATREASLKIEPSSLIDDFVKVTSISAERLTSDVELKALLWKTVDQTSQIIRPATAESLRVLSELCDHMPWWRRWGLGFIGRANVAGPSGRKTARRAVITRASILLFIALIVAVSGQAYVWWGQSIGRDIEQKRKIIEQIETEIRTADQANPSLRKAVELNFAGDQKGAVDLNQERVYMDLLGKIREARASFNAFYDAFHYWYLFLARPAVFWGGSPKEDERLFAEAESLRLSLPDSQSRKSKESREYAEIDQQIMELEWRAYHYRYLIEEHARILLSVLSIYILPLIFGLLGACVFIVRDLNERIREATLTRNVLTRVMIRRQLGMIFGGLVGLLFSPDTVYGATGLSLVAVAFVAGYSVETTVGLMQTFVDHLARTLGAQMTQRLAPKGKA